MNRIIHKFLIINTAECPYLAWFREGIKIAEGCVNTPKYQSICVGDRIVLFNATEDNQFIKGIVTFKHENKIFEKMIQSEDVKNMLPFFE